MRGNGLSADSYAVVSSVDRTHAGDALLVLREIGVAAYVVLDEHGTAQVYADRAALPKAERALRDLATETATEESHGVDGAWEQIVAGFDESAPEPTMRTDSRPGSRPEAPPDPPPQQPPPPGAPPPPRREPPQPWPRPETPDTSDGLGSTPTGWEDEGHFVPPPTPPPPRGDRITRLAWGGLVGGPGLLLAAVVFGIGLPTEVLMVCLLAFVGGLVTLILRMNDNRGDGDDGAVV